MRGQTPNGERIRAIRVVQGHTQRELAELADLDIKTIRKAEQSVRLDVATLTKIAEVLKVELVKILQPVIAGSDPRYEVVAQWCNYFNEQKLEPLLELYHPEGTLIIAGGPDIPFGGEFFGRDKIEQAHVTNWNMVKHEPTNLDECTFLIADEGITLFGDKGVYLPDGKLARFPCVMVFSFREGLIFKHDVQFDTLEFAKRMEVTLRGS
jgi:transcriptional regulator with XRE-family HTH domain